MLKDKANKLINEKSPYLLQHAYNPVDWHSWGKEAFDLAEKEDKPIFVSIGYSTCHWCHVMERESFEDEEVAEVLNKHFISIKVDREERPDIDHIYMSVCQAITGQGGWPLSVFMDKDKKPFYAGTYFPKDLLIRLLIQINDMWKNNKQNLVNSADEIIRIINESKIKKESDLSEDVLLKAYNEFNISFDKHYGGFSKAPKFPSPHNIYFLLRYYHVYKDENALNMVKKTLDSMYEGGIYDHIGFGFCRYSTDEKWLVPHFEKMLYDNALISIAYIEMYQITKDDKYKKIAEDIFTYILRDMTSPEGGFYSAEDADSEGVEGKFYVWDKKEILEILKEDGEEFCKHYDITEGGNFEGKSIPNLIDNKTIDAKKFYSSIKKLFMEREKRVHPFKDDKILTSWNGLMIAALAIGGRVFKEDKFIKASEDAANFIFKKLIDQNGRLLARYRHGESAYLAYAEDYAYLIWGLIELYEGTYEAIYLKKALKLNEEFIEKFWDNKAHGFFVYGKDSEELIMRPKEIYDGAMPSANAVSVFNLVRLSRLTDNNEYEKKAKEILEAFSDSISSISYAHSFSLIGFLNLKFSKDIVVVCNNKEDISKVAHIISDDFNPFLNSIFYFKNKDLEDINENIKNYGLKDGKPTAYICENNTCHESVNDEKSMINLLRV